MIRYTDQNVKKVKKVEDMHEMLCKTEKHTDSANDTDWQTEM